MKRITFIPLALYFIVACAAFVSCQNSPRNNMSTALLNDSNTTSEVIKDNKLVIYQMMTRLYGNKVTTNKPYGTIDENGVGKFYDINDSALQQIKKAGVSHVWFTGIIEHAILTDYSSFGISRDDADVVKGRAGSPYAIKDYYDVNPDLAMNVNNRMQEFESLINRTHANNLKVLIDFVPNHVARVYKSDAKPKGTFDLGEQDDKTKAFDTKNNFYYLPEKSFVVPPDFNPLGNEKGFEQDEKFNETPAKATGNDVFNEAPSINDWFETAKLNYGVDIKNNKAEHFEPIPNTWVKMKDILLYWASKNVDGFRCDMAEMVPTPFWNYAITEVKKAYPKVVFIAEIYNSNAYRNYIDSAGFDYLYDKVGFYDAIRRLTTGKGNVHELNHCWKSETRDISNHMLRFMENHDEQRIASKDFAGNAFDAIPGMVASATMNAGPIMIYFGQDVGEKGEGDEGYGKDDGRTTIYDYWGVPAHQAWMNDGKFDGGKLNDQQKKLYDFYNTLLNLCSKSDAIRKGQFYELQQAQQGNEYYNDSLRLSYLRYSENEKLLIVCNFDKHNEFKGNIAIPAEVQKTLKIPLNKEVSDLLSNQKFQLTDKGVVITIQPMQALIIKLD